MPLKDELALPTLTDAIAVRPESLPVPTGKTERRELRSVNGKTFVHAEKAADGKEIRTFTGRLGAVCYRDDNGELRSIDTTIRDLGTHVGIEWAPYRFKLHETGIGFDFESREGGTCTVTLTGIGGEKFEDSPKPEVADNVITYRDVRPGCDIVFKCLNQRVKTLRILRDESAPRTFDWSVISDRPELIDSTLTGTDAAGNQLELSAVVEGALIHETWTGKTTEPHPQGLGKPTTVVYPVEIDPSVTVNPTANDDDGWEQSGTWYSTNPMYFGSGPPGIEVGVRFPGVSIDQGATVTSATLGLYATGLSGSGGAGTIYGRAADNPGQFGAGASLPSAVSKTTASTAVPTVGSSGAKSWDVTPIVQEIVNRGGFASGNAIAFPLISSGSGTNFTFFAGYEAGSNIPYLSITYTAAGGGTAANLLLLGCG